MNASLYECEVMHHRLKPVQRSFSYRVFMLEVDLDDLPALARSTWCLGHNRLNLFSIDDRDHIDLGLPGGIRPNLLEWLSQQGIAVPGDVKIRLVSFPRVLGYGFNPVSFYFLSHADGSSLCAVAEVVNTYREMKLYAVAASGADGLLHTRLPKNFYVSPFSDPADAFEFKIGIPAESWNVNIDDLDAEGRVLLSAIRGHRRDLTPARLFGFAFKYPLLSLKIIGLIHWHALLMWLRGVPYFRKSHSREAQLDVLRPHPTLNEDPP
jgi:DUF1365 family protein